MFWEDTTMSLAFASPVQPLSLDEYWMPFTANRWFKKNPRMIERGEGVRYFTTKGDALFDFASGLWCTNAGHAIRKSWKRCRSRPPPSITPWPSRSATPRPSAWRLGSPISPRSAQQDLLYQFGLGGRRLGPENRPGVASHARRRGEDPPHRPGRAITGQASAARASAAWEQSSPLLHAPA